MPGPVLKIDNLFVDFPTKDGVVHAVRGVSADLSPGEVLGIVGESGSGKSVTAMATMGLLPKKARVKGSVRFNDSELLGPEREAAHAGARQGHRDDLPGPDDVVEPRLLGRVADRRGHPRPQRRLQVTRRCNGPSRCLHTVGIPNPEERVSSYPHEFSGGMRQRVVIAIAMANDPDVILADEPTTALDVTVQAQVLEALRTALSETHAALLADHPRPRGGRRDSPTGCSSCTPGRPVEIGTVDDIFYRPAMPYTIGLLGSLPRLDAEGDERLRPIPGAPPSMVGDRVGCPFAPRCPLRQPICDTEEPELRAVARRSPTRRANPTCRRAISPTRS